MLQCFSEPSYVRSFGIKIAYFEFGQGFPLILLHGNGEDSSYWKGQVSELSRFFRVIAIDSRGHGCSEYDKNGLSFDLMVEDLKNVLDFLEIKKAHFLGFSDGGNLAIKFSLTYPEYVERLILNGANVQMFRGVKLYVQAPVMLGYALLQVCKGKKERLQQKQDVLGLMIHSYGVKFSDLQRIKANTLLIVGEKDMIKADETQKIKNCIPHCELITVKRADHFVAAKMPAKFNKIVIEFLLSSECKGDIK